VASALQCPACGHKHRLSELTGDPVFSCEQCGRLLKTPVEYRRPDPSAPSAPPRPNGRVQRGGSAARDQTSVLPTPSARARGPAPAPAPSRARRSAPRPPATFTVPLLILGWVLALLLGGVIVRVAAKITGLFTGDSVIDLITGSGWGRFVRLFAIVPFWALATAGLMTLFVEGGRRWQARQAAAPSPRSASRMTVPPEAKRPRRPAPNARPEPTPSPAAAENRSPAGAAAAPRARRIPKRDISS
jgi:hypothetical protein